MDITSQPQGVEDGVYCAIDTVESSVNGQWPALGRMSILMAREP